MAKKSKRDVLENALQQLAEPIDCGEDLHDLEYVLESVASEIAAAGHYRPRSGDDPPSLGEILQRLARKEPRSISKQAANSAERLERLIRRTRYFDEVDEDDLADADDDRQVLHDALREFFHPK